jgi:hypothetical protein
MRIGFSLAIATIIGWVFSAQADLRPLLQPAVARAMPGKESKGRRERGRNGTERRNVERAASRNVTTVAVGHVFFGAVSAAVTD